MSIGVPLTEALILQKTKLESLAAVKNLNLWGSEIGDISILRRLPNVEILALSVNNVRSLKDFVDCKALKELYLRKNEVGSLAELQYLSGLPNLTTLWLCDNPCANHRLYRLFAINCCPQLKQLDNAEVTPSERLQAKKLTSGQLAEVGLVPSAMMSSPASSPARAAAPPAADPAPAPAPVAAPAVAAAAHSSSAQPHQQKQPLGAANKPPSSSSSSSAGGSSRPIHMAPPTSTVAKPVDRQVQKSIVSAVLTLMGELSAESLEFLRGDIDERLKTLRR